MKKIQIAILAISLTGISVAIAQPSFDASPAAIDAPITTDAATPPLPPDPTSDVGGFISTITKLYRDGALIPLSILLFWGLGLALRRYVKWFSEGRRATIFAAIMGGVTTLVQSAAAGTTPNLNMIIAAITAALMLYFNPVPTTAKK